MSILEAMGLDVKQAANARVLEALSFAAGSPSAQPSFDVRDQLETFHASSLVYRCVEARAGAVAQTDLVVVRRRGRRVVGRVQNHPVFDIIEQASELLTETQLIKLIIQHMDLAGNFYAIKGRRNGKFSGLFPIRPDEVDLLPARTARNPGSRTIYRWRPQGRDPHDFTRDQMLHLQWVSPMSLMIGQPPIKAARDDVLADQRAKRATLSFMEHDAAPGGVLVTDQALTDDQADNIRERWRQLYLGPDRRGRVAILGQGTEFKPITVLPKDLEWLNQRKLSIQGILSAFGVPAIFLGVQAENFGNRREQLRFFWFQTVRQMLKDLASQLTERLLRPEFGNDLAFMFDDSTAPLMIEILSTLVDAGAAAVNSRVMTPNEVRQRLLGFETGVTGGDEFLVPISMVPSKLVLEGGTLPDMNGGGQEEQFSAPAIEEKQDGTSTQTFILSKERFKTLEEARKWIRDNDAKDEKVDETEKSWRFRQFPPGDCQDGTQKTIDITDGVKAVICRKKERVLEADTQKKTFHPADPWSELSDGSDSLHLVPVQRSDSHGGCGGCSRE